MTEPSQLDRHEAAERFRCIIAAMGYRAYLLTDDEAWRWMEDLVRPLGLSASEKLCAFKKITEQAPDKDHS